MSGSPVVIYHGANPPGLLGGPFTAYVVREGRRQASTTGIQSAEAAAHRAEEYRLIWGEDAEVRELPRYARFRVSFFNDGVLDSDWDLTDVSIGRVAVRAQVCRLPGDSVVINYAPGAT